MIIVKTEVSVVFDDIEKDVDFSTKWQNALGDVLYNKLCFFVENCIKSGKIIRRTVRFKTGDVNLHSSIISVYPDFDTYEEVRSSPVYYEVRKAALLGGFEYNIEIKYLSDLDI